MRPTNDTTKKWRLSDNAFQNVGSKRQVNISKVTKFSSRSPHFLSFLGIIALTSIFSHRNSCHHFLLATLAALLAEDLPKAQTPINGVILITLVERPEVKQQVLDIFLENSSSYFAGCSHSRDYHYIAIPGPLGENLNIHHIHNITRHMRFIPFILSLNNVNAGYAW